MSLRFCVLGAGAPAIRRATILYTALILQGFLALLVAASTLVSPVRAQPATQQLPVIDVNAASNDAAAAGPPPVKTKYQLPETAESATATQIQQTVNIVDTEDAAKYFPSLFVRKRNNGDTQPVLATRTWGVGSSARSLVYADDILLSALIANNNSIGAPRWGMVAPEEIKRVDFLYGPFAAAYPGNAIGGVLLITTRMPEKFEFNVRQTEAFQTFDHYNTKDTYRTDQSSISIGNKQGDFSWFISGNFQNSYSQPLAWVTTPGFPAGTRGTIPQLNKVGQPANVVGAGGLLHTDMGTFKGKFAWDITPWLTASYIVGLWSNDQNSKVQTYLTNAAGSPTFGSVAGFANNYYQLTEKHLANALSVKSDTRGPLDFDLAIARYDYLQDIQNNPFGVIAGTADFTKNGRQARMNGTNWTNADFKGIWRADDGHEVSFGLHGDRYVLNNPSYATPSWTADVTGATYTNSRGATQTLALWMQDAWRFAPSFKLTLGGRLEGWRAFDGYNLATTTNSSGAITSTTIASQPAIDATTFSPKASLLWEPAPDWGVTASFGQAYRFPTVTELYQIVQTGPVFSVPNPNLTPENALSEELAIERAFPDGKVRLSLFNEYVHNALISQTNFLNGPAPVTFVTNVDAIRNTGVELAARKDNFFIAGMEAFGSVTYVDSRILSDPAYASVTGVSVVGNHVPQVPDWRATFGATYRPNGFWAFTAAARYSGKQYSSVENNDIVPNVYGAFDRFFVVDLRAQYRLNDRAWINLGIDNVANYSYTLFHPFPGRTYVIDAKVQF